MEQSIPSSLRYHNFQNLIARDYIWLNVPWKILFNLLFF